MLHRIKKIAGGIYSRYFAGEKKTSIVQFAGISVNTIEGTIRSIPDQDDAWYFFLTGKYHRIFDIGANIGFTAIMAKIQDPKKELLLADPNPMALSTAAKNLILNNWAWRCHFYNAFVSEKSGEQIPFFTVGTGAAGSMFKGHAESAAAIGSSYLVPTITIDDLVKLVGWNPELVKVDVEGAESFVLQGATKLAREEKAVFMVEMHSPPELPMIENAERILQWCREHNYQAWYMKDSVRLKEPAQIAQRGKCHLLLMPADLDYPEELKGIRQGDSLHVIR